MHNEHVHLVCTISEAYARIFDNKRLIIVSVTRQYKVYSQVNSVEYSSLMLDLAVHTVMKFVLSEMHENRFILICVTGSINQKYGLYRIFLFDQNIKCL